MITDSDGTPVTHGCEISFSFGIPPITVKALVVQRDGVLTALTPGLRPDSCPVAKLRAHVGDFWVRDPAIDAAMERQ